nr:MAG TPA: hypothetical protein [Caudoviricetes sp.]
MGQAAGGVIKKISRTASVRDIFLIKIAIFS